MFPNTIEHIMSSPPHITALIQQPDAFRGLDHLIDCARRVLDRYTRLPERRTDQRPLSRVA